MVSPEQCRAARAWLGWSQDDLAKRAKVGLSTLKDFEGGKRAPMRNNLEAIRTALESEGIRFIYAEDGKPLGVSVQGAQGQAGQMPGGTNG